MQLAAEFLCCICKQEVRADYYVRHNLADGAHHHMHFGCLRRSMTNTYSIVFPAKDAVTVSTNSSSRGAKVNTIINISPSFYPILCLIFLLSQNRSCHVWLWCLAPTTSTTTMVQFLLTTASCALTNFHHFRIDMVTLVPVLGLLGTNIESKRSNQLGLQSWTSSNSSTRKLSAASCKAAIAIDCIRTVWVKKFWMSNIFWTHSQRDFDFVWSPWQAFEKEPWAAKD